MNFWKRLRNWKNYVIKWLGGYTEAEYKAGVHSAAKPGAELMSSISMLCIRVNAKLFGPFEGIDKLRRRARTQIAAYLGDALVDKCAYAYIKNKDELLVQLAVMPCDSGND